MAPGLGVGEDTVVPSGALLCRSPRSLAAATARASGPPSGSPCSPAPSPGAPPLDGWACRPPSAHPARRVRLLPHAQIWRRNFPASSDANPPVGTRRPWSIRVRTRWVVKVTEPGALGSQKVTRLRLGTPFSEVLSGLAGRRGPRTGTPCDWLALTPAFLAASAWADVRPALRQPIAGRAVCGACGGRDPSAGRATAPGRRGQQRDGARAGPGGWRAEGGPRAGPAGLLSEVQTSGAESLKREFEESVPYACADPHTLEPTRALTVHQGKV